MHAEVTKIMGDSLHCVGDGWDEGCHGAKAGCRDLVQA